MIHKSVFDYCGWISGHAISILRVPSKRALNQAKKHIGQYYLTVGVTESVNKFLQVLEKLLPSYFTGSAQLYNKKKGLRLTRSRSIKVVLYHSLQERPVDLTYSDEIMLIIIAVQV